MIGINSLEVPGSGEEGQWRNSVKTSNPGTDQVVAHNELSRALSMQERVLWAILIKTADEDCRVKVWVGVRPHHPEKKGSPT